jgi:REP-associated tyrosine transposase
LGPSPLDAALLYVDLNPVRAAMTGTATAWEWSSARAHVWGHDESGLLSRGGLARLGGCADWEQRLQRGQAATAERALRRATRTGAPFADAAFREQIERQLKLAADRPTATVVGSVRAQAAADQAR